ncbi:subunit of the Arp2/3 complex [Orbilia oligospora]|uniref:Actin-related protein 2/3 complex subunit 3 n=1 Tax=Orbilia oligospora TaxID=2813651 RepID=A0A7C8R951_ORBOL|nr:subunit of the Arp2/3 complex [Orbilia oligospora]
MPAYHSSFLSDTDVRIIGNFGLLPLRTRTRGPAYTLPLLGPEDDEIHVDPESESYDILDETLVLFRANTLFRNFEIKGPADRVLIYGILFISECLGKIKPNMSGREAEKVIVEFTCNYEWCWSRSQSAALNTLALEHFALPGDPTFPLNALFAPARDRNEADTLRQYISQIRQELTIRLLSRVYFDSATTPSKWWLSFTKRKFMGKNL